MHRELTTQQSELLDELHKRFGLDTNRILFLNEKDLNEPWIPPDELMSIARQHGGFELVSVVHDKFISETRQQVYTGMVTDLDRRSFVRSGVATIGETPAGVEIDVDVLASGRALSAALRDAGFHPFRSGSVIDLQIKKPAQGELTAESSSRRSDLARIHIIAEEKGLIVKTAGNTDMSKYRLVIKSKFGVASAAVLDEPERKAVINFLENFDPAAVDDLKDVPEEFIEDAKAA